LKGYELPKGVKSLIPSDRYLTPPKLSKTLLFSMEKLSGGKGVKKSSTYLTTKNQAYKEEIDTLNLTPSKEDLITFVRDTMPNGYDMNMVS